MPDGPAPLAHGYVEDPLTICVLYQHLSVFSAAPHHSFVGISITINLVTIRIEQNRHIAAVIPNLFFCPEQIDLGIFAALNISRPLLPAMNDNGHTRQKDQVIWEGKK